MKFRLSTAVSILIIFFVAGCERTSDTTNQFITDFLREHTVQVYKSEIQRARVNYIPSTKLLVYSFWKKKMFDKNGDLFLHIYIKDTALLPEARKKHGFMNLSINKEDIIHMDSLNFYITKDLSSFVEFDSFITGQYIGTKRTWFAKHEINKVSAKDFPSYNNTVLDSIKNTLNAKTKLEEGIGIGVPGQGMIFLNYLLAFQSKLIFKEENVFNVFWNQDASQVYFTYTKDSNFLDYEYSLDFYEGTKKNRTLAETIAVADRFRDLTAGTNKVFAIKVDVPERTKSMTLFRLDTAAPKVLFNANLD